MKKITLLALIGVTVVGCSVGSAPETLTPEQTREAVKKLPIDQQIDYINRSPLSQAEKEQKIAALKAGAGK